MPTSKPDENRNAFGDSFKRNRESNNISQQNLHTLCATVKPKIKLYNSQFSHLEQGRLVPKPEFFVELAKLNKVIASGKYPPTQGAFNKTVRDKFKDFEPYLDAENNPVVDGYMFYALFVGERPINKKYKFESVKITEDVCLNISQYARTVFSGFATDEMITRKEAWELFLPYLEKDLNKKTQRRIQSVLAGQSEYTLEEVDKMTNGGTLRSCVVNDALSQWTGKKLPNVIEIWTKGSIMKWPQLTA